MAVKGINYIKCLIFTSPSTESFIFKLCYRWTVLLLVVFSFVVTCKLAFGNSFVCTSTVDSSPYVNIKCYTESVYTLPSKLIIQNDKTNANELSSEDFRRYQHYYSWVNLMFLVFAFNFYLPHLLWKSYESGYVYKLVSGVQGFSNKEEKRGLELCYLAKYVLISQGKHKLYTSLYIFFEICNYIICLAQTVWLVHFFDVTGVPDILPFVTETWSDFRQFYFPPSGMCEYQKYGASLIPQRHTVMCEMPLNRLFMYMFLFLHAWFIFISILTGLNLVYRVLLLIPSVRAFVSKSTTQLAERSVIKSLCYRMSYSDWFFLTRLQKAMTDIDFTQLLDKIIIVSQGKEEQKEDEISSIFEERMKDFDNSEGTSPL